MNIRSIYIEVAAIIAVLAAIYLSSLYNYLLFHSLVEIFSIAVAAGIFMVSWNARRFLDNHYLFFLGIAYVFIGTLDTIHTLSYTGMNIFTEFDSNLPTQLWISSRYIQSLSLLTAPFFIKKRINSTAIFSIFLILTSGLLLSIFFFKNFPVCYIEGTGLTPFKKISEYIISMILLASAFLLYTKRQYFESNVLKMLISSIVLTIVSELFFTGYFSVYDTFNLLGHIFKLCAFYLIYKAIIKTGLEKPYDILFRNLKKSEEALRLSEKKYKMLFNNAADSIFLHSLDGNLIDVNEIACSSLGYQYEELKKLNKTDIISQEEASRLPERIKKVSEEGIGYFESVYKRIDNTTFPVEINSCLIEYEGEKVILAVVRDITLRKDLEKKINRMRRENEAFLRPEIKNLISPLKGFINIVLQSEEKLSEQNSEYLKRVNEISSKLNSLVDSLKNLHDFEFGNYELNLTGINITNLVKIAVSDLKSYANTHKVDIILKNNADKNNVKIDFNLMPGVFFNLIKNAIEHIASSENETDRSVKVNIFNEDGRVVITVNNKGEPVPPEKIDTFFDKFNTKLSIHIMFEQGITMLNAIFS